MTLAVGTRIGAREIRALISEDDVARTYSAYEPALERTVALTVIRPEVALRTGVAERFREQAQILGKLTHPNIVTIFDAEEIDGQLVIATQLVDGTSLQKRAAASELTPEETVGIVRQIAEALDHAHAQGVVHGGLTLADVTLTSQGRALASGFGIAAIVGRLIEPDHAALRRIARQLLGDRSVEVPPTETAIEFATALANALGVKQSTRTFHVDARQPIETPRRSARKMRRPLAIAAASLAGLLAVGGIVLVARPATSSGGSAAAGWAPTAVPTRSAPARGALLWQAKLDGSQELTAGQVGPTESAARPSGAPTQLAQGGAELRFLPGAIEFAITADGGSLFTNLPFTMPSAFVAEVDLSYDPAANGAVLNWLVRGDVPDPSSTNPRLVITCCPDPARAGQPGVQGIQLNRGRGPTISGQTLEGPVKVPQAATGEVFTIGVRAVGQTLAVYLNGDRLWEVDEPSVAPVSSSFHIQAQGRAGRFRIVGLRIYAVS